MRTAVSILAMALALSACGQASESVPMTPAAPSIHLPAISGAPAAGYFELRISGDQGALVSVTSPQAGRIEMHETTSSGEMSSMRPLARVPVRDGEMLRFAPGGRHLMLFELAPTVRPGGRIPLILHFERGAPRALAFGVEAAGEAHGRH